MKTLKAENLKAQTIEEINDMLIGKIGTTNREQFEIELEAELLGEQIKKLRIQNKLTQEELGEKIGVQKAQISKIENGHSGTNIGTIQKVFKALNIKVKFKLEIDNKEFAINS